MEACEPCHSVRLPERFGKLKKLLLLYKIQRHLSDGKARPSPRLQVFRWHAVAYRCQEVSSSRVDLPVCLVILTGVSPLQQTHHAPAVPDLCPPSRDCSCYDRPQLWRPPTFVCMLLVYSNEITFDVVRWNGNDTVSRH